MSRLNRLELSPARTLHQYGTILPFSTKPHNKANPQVYWDIGVGGKYAGRVIIEVG